MGNTIVTIKNDIHYCIKCNQFRSAMVKEKGQCNKCKIKELNQKDKIAKNTQKHRVKTRNKSLQQKYGINLDDYEEMLINQNYCCKICENSFQVFSKPLVVDHNHKTGKVRGLLCNNCNIGLGAFKDQNEILEKAIQYLKNNLEHNET